VEFNKTLGELPFEKIQEKTTSDTNMNRLICENLTDFIFRTGSPYK
jgi:hypothetical protein